jgi:hypothetical protein
MTKISSPYNKRLPIIGASLGLVAFVAALGMAIAQSKAPFPFPVFLPLIVIPLIIFVLYRFFHDIVDEMWDDGNALVAKNKGQQVRIPLADIINVNYSLITNPPRVTLTLRNPTQFGKEVTFIVKRPFTLNFSMRNAVIDDLIQRIDVERRK